MRKHLVPLLLFLASLALYVATLAPTVVTIFDDSLEMQLALPTLAILHPTGYPLYTLLGWLTTHLVPLGDAAYGANLFSALAAAGAVAMLFQTARRLGSAVAPAAAAALLLAASPVWWSQATIAEVYAFQGLLTLVILYAALRWDGSRSGRWLVGLGLALGLGLAHHRLTLLLVPALALFLLWTDPGLWRRPRAWVRPLLAMLAPLLLYGLLPLRADVGSLDGSYGEIGFWRWVLGGGYSAFLSDNPFGIERGFGDVFGLVVAQFGLAGIAVVLAGLQLWLMQPRRLALLALIALADLLFAARYLVADIEVFLIPAILVLALFLAVGLTALWDAVRVYAAALARRYRAPLLLRASTPLLGLLLLLWPALLAAQRLPAQDRSRPPARAWGVHDYGLDMLGSMEKDATLAGILGEMTLVRYFQRTEGLRTDVETVAADDEGARLAAIERSLAEGRPTYTTRPLAGLPQRYSLGAAGPLIRIRPTPPSSSRQPANPASILLTPAVRLVGWDTILRQPRSGPSVRLRLAWRVESAPGTDFKISARLLATDGTGLAQTDAFPVHNAYPPTLWRVGETVIDGYDLPLAAPPAGPVSLLVILYDPADGSEFARWQQDGVVVGEGRN